MREPIKPQKKKTTKATTEKPTTTTVQSSPTTKAFTVPEGGRTLAVENIFGSLFVTRRVKKATNSSGYKIHSVWFVWGKLSGLSRTNSGTC